MKFFGLNILLICLLTISPNLGNGQAVNGLPVVRNYTPQEYKSHRQNWQITQAPNGILYFANGKGLLSFNGEDWDLTMMPNRGHVRSLDVNENGTVYVGANNDFGQLTTKFSGERTFKSFLPLIDSVDHNFGRIRKTISTPEGVYFQAYQRIFRLKNEKVKTWQFESTVYRIFYIHNELYAIDLDQGLLVLKNDEFVSVKNGLFLKQTRINVVLPFGKNLLIGTRNNGLFIYDHQQFYPFKTDADPIFKNDGLYEGLVNHDDNIVLISDLRNGIFVLNKKGGIERVINQQTGISSVDVLSIFEDQNSSLWIGTQEGITRIDYNSPYSVYDDRLGLKGTIQSIISFENQIYAASSDGLIKVNSSALKDTISEVGNINSYCWEIEQWKDQLIIASTKGAFALRGNEMFALQNGIQFTSAISKSPHDSLVIILALDDGLSYQKWNGSKWIEKGRITGVSGAVRDVIEDEKGAFWLKTRSNGIFRLKMPVQHGAINFDEFVTQHFDQKKGLPQGEHNFFKIDDQLLVRSEQDSLYIFDRSTDRFVLAMDWGKKFGFEKGLVLPKTKEQNGILWLDYFESDKKWLLRAEKKLDGTYKIDQYPLSSKMVNFKDPYGNEVFFANKKHLWFGGMKGILQVDLEKLTPNSGSLPLLITEVRSSEMPVFISGTDLNNHEIAFQQNDLSFKFSSPFYQNKAFLQYATFLEGYDKGWSEWTKTANKSYTNLPSGNYSFKVKAKNDFDHQSEIISYSFRIKPPWFATPWAMISYFVLAVLLIWMIIHLRSAKLRKEQIRLEKIVDERTEEIKKQAEEINELYEVKNRFLANISHELRTPLTLILGPAEQMLSSVSEKAQKKQLSWIHQNSRKLLRLINQLLDLSKIEAGKLELKVNQQDLIKFCKFICSAFESLAKQKKITLTFKSSIEHLFLFFDAEKLEQVLNNLLNNAFKFTEKGQVVFEIEELTEGKNTFAKITVKDSGIGIHEKQLPFIFDRFYQADQGEETFYKGTGIGLALCKELVELHSGKIEAKSELGKGTAFTVFLPIENTHLEPEITQSATDYVPKEPVTSIEDNKVFEKDELANDVPLVLVVDDNEDIIEYIRHQLGNKFKLLKAHDGKAGLEIAEKELPDLIVSDVMMPRMDGFELCAKLKNDIKTDHIPVILLTARIGEEDKMRGLQIQADDYLQKPFNSKELEIRIQNLIDNRKKLRKRFAERHIFKAAEIAETPKEAEFLKQLTECVEARINDLQFDVNELCKLLGMSKSQLNRKMKAVLNKSPNQFIRSYRLERAHQLIKIGQNTISEIAYDVGFSSPAYFSKCFHDEFGYPPSALTEQD